MINTSEIIMQFWVNQWVRVVIMVVVTSRNKCLQSENCQECLLPPHSSNPNKKKWAGLSEHFHTLLLGICMMIIYLTHIYFTIICFHSFFFHPSYSSFITGAFHSSGLKVGNSPEQDASHYRAQSHPRSLPPGPGRCRCASEPHVHSFGMWEETLILRENPRRHGENMQTPHRQRPWSGIHFIFLSML